MTPNDNSDESKEITDDEKDSDSNFMDSLNIPVYFEDLPQKYKGQNINEIGRI